MPAAASLSFADELHSRKCTRRASGQHLLVPSPEVSPAVFATFAFRRRDCCRVLGRVGQRCGDARRHAVIASEVGETVKLDYYRAVWVLRPRPQIECWYQPYMASGAWVSELHSKRKNLNPPTIGMDPVHTMAQQGRSINMRERRSIFGRFRKVPDFFIAAHAERAVRQGVQSSAEILQRLHFVFSCFICCLFLSFPGLRLSRPEISRTHCNTFV